MTLNDEIHLPDSVFHFLNEWAEESEEYDNIFDLIESILCTIAYDKMPEED